MEEPCYNGFDTDQLGAAMDQLNGLHNAALWQLLRVVAAYERKGACESDGMRTMAEWLSTRYGISLATAPSWVEASSALEGLPLLAQAFAQGRLRFDKLTALLPSSEPGQRVGAVGAGAQPQPQCPQGRRGMTFSLQPALSAGCGVKIENAGKIWDC